MTEAFGNKCDQSSSSPINLGIGVEVKDINSACAVAVCLVPQVAPSSHLKAVQETSCA
eukprot:CAMPEP_0114692294 /NCGR_PEP_ID=MMETSP0191-20121206/67777_1 /TAXON_ID=126664 /ORGANISM="Sorites sp." /LENGTH=57 /DNA_ID=CAMNT_0001984519 /DNA_START=176 /DNA_END=349 /DNA_ORIENTATION=-